MKTEWIDPKIIIGAKATGEYYYPRSEIEDEIWQEIEKGNHLLLASPKRFGKSSILIHLSENAMKGYKCIFEDIEGEGTANSFYKRFYELILTGLRKDKKIWKIIKNKISSIGIDEISVEGKVKFTPQKQLNYVHEIKEILDIVSGKNAHLVLFVDELPIVLFRLYKKGKIEEAKSILKNLREWRQSKYPSFSLVISGSIGIHHVVKAIDGRSSDINDFYELEIEAFSIDEAMKYIDHVTKNATVQYDEILKKYLLAKVNYLIPYFINLMLNEINKMCRKKHLTSVTKTEIDIAFDQVIRHHKNLQDFKSRIFEYFKKEEAEFLNEVLLYIAHKDRISKLSLFDIAVKHDKKIKYMDLIDNLIRDGYIKMRDDHFVFVSPFLKAFWKNNQPVYDEK